jgi:hypothetical protein
MLDDPLDRLDPRAKKAFLGEIARRGTDLDDFEVRFLELPLGYLVYTMSKHRPPELRGADSDHPEIEVRISKATFEVVGVASVK